MLTDKEVNYVKDHLSWELLAVKKCHMYADQMQDEELKSLVHELGQLHQNRYQRLLKHLNQANAGATSNGGAH